MHVCYLFHRTYPANFSTAINEYTRTLADLGVDISVIVGRNSTDVPEHEVVNGVDVYRILTDTSTSVSVEPTVFAYRASKKVEELVQERGVDVLHVGAFPNLGLFLRPFPRSDTPPIVADVRGTAVRNALFDYVSRIGIRIQRHIVEKMVVIDQNVVDSIWGDDADVTIVPLGVDLARYRPGENEHLRRTWGIDGEKYVLGYIGNLHRSRRLDRLIDAFAESHRHCPDLRLVIVGSGEARGELEERAEQLDVRNRITFTGEVPFERIPAYLRAFDAGLAYVPDKPQYRDQPPLKTVEYLAAGLPVVATDTPGNRRFVTHERNGLLAPDSKGEYSEAIRTLVASSELRERFSTNARNSVREYDYETIVKRNLLPVYEELTRS